MTWNIFASGKAKKPERHLSEAALGAFFELLSDLKNGPEQPNWPHYGKLGPFTYHCHLKRGRPTYVACWMADKRTKTIEVYYAGTHENAPY